MRMGKRHVPTYRIVAIDSRKARDGKYIENIGHYDPRTKNCVLKRERINYWITKGAQPTVRVAKLIAKDQGGSHEGAD